MKKLVILSMALVFGVSVSFAQKTITTPAKAKVTTTDNSAKTQVISGGGGGIVTPPTSKTGTITQGTALPDKVGAVQEDNDGPAIPPPVTTAGKTTNTGINKAVLPGSTKVVPSTTINSRDITIDKGDIKGGINPVAAEETNSTSVTLSLADYMPTTDGTSPKTPVSNPAIGNPKTATKDAAPAQELKKR